MNTLSSSVAANLNPWAGGLACPAFCVSRNLPGSLSKCPPPPLHREREREIYIYMYMYYVYIYIYNITLTSPQDNCKPDFIPAMDRESWTIAARLLQELSDHFCPHVLAILLHSLRSAEQRRQFEVSGSPFRVKKPLVA